jgi:hypothetical protein
VLRIAQGQAAIAEASRKRPEAGFGRVAGGLGPPPGEQGEAIAQERRAAEGACFSEVFHPAFIGTEEQLGLGPCCELAG